MSSVNSWNDSTRPWSGTDDQAVDWGRGTLIHVRSNPKYLHLSPRFLPNPPCRPKSLPHAKSGLEQSLNIRNSDPTELCQCRTGLPTLDTWTYLRWETPRPPPNRGDGFETKDLSTLLNLLNHNKENSHHRTTEEHSLKHPIEENISWGILLLTT